MSCYQLLIKSYLVLLYLIYLLFVSIMHVINTNREHDELYIYSFNNFKISKVKFVH